MPERPLRVLLVDDDPDDVELTRQLLRRGRVPVLILTTSNAREEVVGGYKLGADGCVNKPLGIEQFGQVEEVVEDFWVRSRLRNGDS